MLESEQNSNRIASDVVSTAADVPNPNSESTQHSTGTRKLQRVSKAPDDIRAAKLAARNQNRSADSAGRNVQKPEDFIGVTLADGRYTVKSQLGKGSMAYVFLAADSRLETDVVVKVPKPEIIATKDFRERFKRETQLLVKFSHPHVVSVLDIGEFEQLPYVVMQLLSGGSLADQMKQNGNAQGQMELDTLKQWLPGVSRALDFCYRKGMVHRDVKPANILFDEDSNAFVADFGLSKVMYGDHADANSSETAAGIVLGTPNYISPEIVLAKDYDGRADQYSLGITVYHALCGKAPMQGNSATATMVNQTQKQLPSLAEVRPDVSERLGRVVQKSIEKNPDKRFKCCEDFADAIVDALRIPRKNVSPAAVAKKPSVASTAGSTRSNASRATAQPATASEPASSRSSRQQSPARKASSSSKPRRAPKADDWLSTPATAALPPRKGKSQKKVTRGKKKSNTKSLFGQQLSTPLAAALGGLVVLLVVVKVFFSGPDDAAAEITDATGAAQASAPVTASARNNRSDSGSQRQGNAAHQNRKQQGSRGPQASPAMLANGTGTSLWLWDSTAENVKPTVAQDGMTVTTRPVSGKDKNGNPKELQITVEKKKSTKSWAQVVIKGGDFARAEQFADASAALTKQDLDKIQIQLDYSLPKSIEISVSLQAGPKSDVWQSRTLKLTGMLRGSDGKGHAVINVADVDDALQEKFLRTMNGDTTQSRFFLKFGVQARGKKQVPDCEFTVSNVRVIAKP